MKQRGLKFLSLLLTLVLLIGVLPGMSAFADTQIWTSGATTVTFNDDDSPTTLTVSGTGAMADYASQADVPWRSYRRAVQSGVIRGGVTSIGEAAFYNFSNMTSVSIPSSVTSIGAYAFRQCTSLTSVVIPNGVTSIGEAAFFGCTSLTSVVIPSSVTSIGEHAFYNCRALTSVVISNGVTNIGERAFSGCTGLDGTNLNIPGSVTSIGERAFNGVNFTSVTFEPGVNGATLTIGDNAITNDSTTLAYGSGNAKLYYENGNEVLEGTLMTALSDKTLTWKSTGFTMTFQRGRGTGVDQPLPATAGADYQLPDGNNMFTAPEGEVFDCWKDTDTGVTYKAMATIPNVSKNYTLEAQWKKSGTDGGGSGSFVDLVFNIPGVDNSWEYAPGYAPQQAYRVSLAPMQGGSAALGLTTGDSGTALNVYPTSAVYVFPNADPGYTLDKIVWSLIDGSASYDITEAKNFVMPAMDVVVYVTFRPVA